jgi:hypothetical protein
VASQNLIHAKKQLAKSLAIAVLVMPELGTVDFARQRRLQADCSVSSGEVTRVTTPDRSIAATAIAR